MGQVRAVKSGETDPGIGNHFEYLGAETVAVFSGQEAAVIVCLMMSGFFFHIICQLYHKDTHNP